jgi:hypothetical protein
MLFPLILLIVVISPGINMPLNGQMVPLSQKASITPKVAKKVMSRKSQKPQGPRLQAAKAKRSVFKSRNIKQINCKKDSFLALCHNFP